MNKNGSYIFTVKFDTGIWRKIQISKTATLHDLHEAIQFAYHFDDDHLYAFFMDNRPWSDDYFLSPRDNEGPSAAKAKLYQLGLAEKAKFLYLFDYGDEWRFQVTLFKELDEEVSHSKLVEVKGEAPKQYPDFDDDDEEEEEEDEEEEEE